MKRERLGHQNHLALARLGHEVRCFSDAVGGIRHRVSDGSE